MEIPKNENNNFEKSTEKALPSLEEFINERQDGKKIDFHEGQYIEPPGVIQKVANGIVIGTEAIIDTTKDKIHHLVDAIGNVTHSAIETAENMKENISDTVHFVGEKIIFTKDKMEESVKETTQSASEKIDKISNSIQETTKEAANGIKEKVYKVGDFTQEELSKVNQIFEEGEKKYQQMEEKSGQAIKEKILETSESLAEKLAVIPPVLPTSEKESELHQKRKIEAKEPQKFVLPTEEEVKASPISESFAAIESSYLGEVKKSSPVSVPQVELPKIQIPTIPIEAVDQPMVVALDFSHEWKTSDHPLQDSETKAWSNPEKTSEIISNLASETEKSEVQFKRIIEEQSSNENFFSDHRR